MYIAKFFINRFGILTIQLNECIDNKNNFNLFAKIMCMIDNMMMIKLLINQSFGWYFVIYLFSDFVCIITIGFFTVKVEFELNDDKDYLFVIGMLIYILPSVIKVILVFVSFEKFGKQVRKAIENYTIMPIHVRGYTLIT